MQIGRVDFRVVLEHDWVERLKQLLGSERVLSSEAAGRAYDCDAYSIDRSRPTAIVLPTSTDEVAEIVRICVENEIPFTPRGAGTGLSGGAMAAQGGVVVSTKKLTKILEVDIDAQCLLAQAGIANKRISDAVFEHGLHFAPDPSSQSVSTLGGNIAENSGGPHTLKYGVTAPHILGVTMVSVEGEVLHFGGRDGRDQGFDFVDLIVGSEGTLGIVTEAWVRLTPLPKHTKTCLASFDSVSGATESVAAIIATGIMPAAMELMDRGILAALRAAFNLEYPDGSDALLLLEFDGDDLAAVERELESSVRICAAHGSIDVRVAKDEAERQALWTARKKGIGAMGRLAPSIVTHDGVIPRSKLPEMLDYVYAVAAEHHIGVANLFHAGDGNLHPCFYFDDRDPEQVRAVIAAGEKIIGKCISLGGSISGEHGIGVEKLDLMTMMFSEDDLNLQSMAKEIFALNSLCNPCKVIPNQKGCVEHQKRWRGVAW